MDELEQALRTISRAWGRRQEGYVFFPWIDREQQRREGIRRAGFHEGRAFRWPQERAEILDHLRAHTQHDLYWCPSIFEYDTRRGDLAGDEHALWADLDEVDPATINRFEPTIAWETSPGRYQALWVLSAGDIQGASWPGNENQRLTYYLGADQSGWDTTQLLRIPGWVNHKIEYKDDDGNSPKGKLLWANGRTYLSDDFEDLPPVASVAASSELTDVVAEEVQHIDRLKVLARVKLKLTKRIRDLLSTRTVLGDRSEVLWEIERSLADAGCGISEIVAIVQPTVWNKYDGRADELKRLVLEATKALASKPEKVVEAEEARALEEDNISKQTPIRFSDAIRNIRKPRWLVKDILTQGGVGFIAGEPKAFKSWVALDLALSVATGAPFLDYWKVVKPGPVLYIQEEDPPSILKARVGSVWRSKRRDKMKLEPGGIVWEPPSANSEFDPDIHVMIQADITISDEAWQLWLDDQLEQGMNGEPYALVIIDTLMMVAGDVDENRAQEMTTKIFKPLKLLMRKHGASLQLVHHMRKSSEDKRGGQRLLGSVANHAWAEDSIYLQLANTGTLQFITESKSVGGKHYRLDGVVQGHGWSPVISNTSHSGMNEPPGKPSKSERVIEILQTSSVPLTSLQVANKLGYAKTGYTSLALKQLEVQGHVLRTQGRPMKWVIA